MAVKDAQREKGRKRWLIVGASAALAVVDAAMHVGLLPAVGRCLVFAHAEHGAPADPARSASW